jgi:hypothetical protein
MSFDPSLPAPSSRIISAELRNQFTGLKSLIDAGSAPIGCVMAWLKNLPGTPALPASWLECNGQTVNDAASPFNGLDLPDLNGTQGGSQRFLRGAASSGGTGGSDLMNIPSEVPVDNNMDASTTTVVSGPQSDLPALPSYFEVVWMVRVK